MPDFGAGFGGGPVETAARTVDSSGILVSAPASANTKGAWVELFSALAHPVAWVHTTLLTAATGTPGGRFLLDLGIGAAGVEQVVVPDLYCETFNGFQHASRSYVLPLVVPRSTRLAARVAGNPAGTTVAVAVTVIPPMLAGVVSGLGGVSAFGVNSAATRGAEIDPGALASTDGAWVELSAATPFATRWLMLGVGHNMAAMTSTSSWLIDLGIGPAGSEVVIVPDLAFSGNSNNDLPLPGAVSLPANIPPNARLSARARCLATATPTRLIDVIAYGVG